MLPFRTIALCFSITAVSGNLSELTHGACSENIMRLSEEDGEVVFPNATSDGWVCAWHIDSSRQLEAIEFNTTLAELAMGDTLEFYTNFAEAQRGRAVGVFGESTTYYTSGSGSASGSGRRLQASDMGSGGGGGSSSGVESSQDVPALMTLTGSNEALIVLRAAPNSKTRLRLHYHCRVLPGLQIFSWHVTPKRLSLWMGVWSICLCVCCGSAGWLLKSRRNHMQGAEPA